MVSPGWGCLLCLLSFGFPSTVFLHSSLFKGTCTGTGMYPTSLPTTLLDFLPLHLPSYVFPDIPLLCLTRAPIFHLFSSISPAPFGVRGLPLSSMGWNPMFTFSSVSAPLCGALRSRKRICCCTWACLLPCYLMKGVRMRTREGEGNRAIQNLGVY